MPKVQLIFAAMSFFTQLLADLTALGWIDWVVTITALIYVVLAARANVWGWAFGIVSCALWAYASFVLYDLYLDAFLQLFYVVMGGWGIYSWLYGGKNGQERAITQLLPGTHVALLLLGAILTFLFGYLFQTYTEAAATYWDAGTTMFSIIATFLLVRKHRENWLYWIIIDLCYAGLYYSRGALLFAVLMIIYTIIAWRAWIYWGKEENVA